MSNLGFSLDRNFNASDAIHRRARGLEPIAARVSQNTWRRTAAPLVALALAALFAALAAKFLF